MIAILLLSKLLLVGAAQAELTEQQSALVVRLRARGISEERLTDLVASMEGYNNPPPPPYIPPHAEGDLRALSRWYVGASYAGFANLAGLDFDNEAYMADCPNLPFFGFALNTGTAYLDLDVSMANTNTGYQLMGLLGKGQDHFREEYLRLIRDTEFYKYIKFPPDAQAPAGSVDAPATRVVPTPTTAQ